MRSVTQHTGIIKAFFVSKCHSFTAHASVKFRSRSLRKAQLFTKLTKAQQHYVHNFTQIGKKMGSMNKYFMPVTVPIFMQLVITQ